MLREVHTVQSNASDEDLLLFGDVSSGCVGMSEALFEGVILEVGVMVYNGSS
jgi:hypothetical protein